MCLLAQNACAILRREQVYKYVRFFINASVICVRVCVCMCVNEREMVFHQIYDMFTYVFVSFWADEQHAEHVRHMRLLCNRDMMLVREFSD